MALTEQPVDIVQSLGPYYDVIGGFVLGDHTKRSSWVNSFYINGDPAVGFGYGAVMTDNGAIIDQYGINHQGDLTGLLQMYLSEARTAVVLTVTDATSLNPTFPAGSLPLTVVVQDSLSSPRQVIDMRSSYLFGSSGFVVGKPRLTESKEPRDGSSQQRLVLGESGKRSLFSIFSTAFPDFA